MTAAGTAAISVMGTVHAQERSMEGSNVSYPKTDRSRAHAFWLQITRYQPHKLAGHLTGISEHTAKKYRYGDLPGRSVIERWRARFGPAFSDFIEGKHDSAELAALQAQREEINRRIEALEK